MEILTNLSSLNAQRSYARAGEGLATSMQRLSSGQRINSARDDAAGLVISERLSADVRGYNQAARNVNDGISLLQVADGAVSTVMDNFQRLRELAVQAGNDSNSDTDRQALQKEADALVKSNLQISADAKFNNINLLDGSYRTQLQVGAAAGDTLTVDIPKLFSLPTLGTVSVDVPEQAANIKAQAGQALTAGALTINNSAIGATVAGGQAGQSAASAWAVANAINAAAPKGGVAATASTDLSGDVANGAAIGANTISINGVALGAISGANANALAASAAAAINGAAGATGVTASSSGGTLSLNAADGRDINVGGASAGIIGLGGGSHHGIVTVTDTASGYVHNVAIGGLNPGAAGFSAGLIASKPTGNTVTILQSANTGGEQAIDLSSNSGASQALDYIDSKIDAASSLRAYLGATQNRLEKAYDNATSETINLSAARERIRDTDYASETAQLTRSKILQQAGASMVAQANSLPQQALLLLR